ncbi:MFS general substrate transporter [Mycena polygramma]|nr:MFS general substrate transporter [Mycena polygramma]
MDDCERGPQAMETQLSHTVGTATSGVSTQECCPAPSKTDPSPSTTISAPVDTKRTARFWLISVALCFCTLLSALDLGGVGTAAPTIVHDLKGGDFTWVSSAYTLSSAACIPISGNMAQIFGRRPILLLGIILFATGSAISGAAPTMTVLIVGRGIGGGIAQSLTSIVVADLVALRERGMFIAITGVIWSVGVVGPFIAGSLSQKASWRWLFYLNVPLACLTFIVVFVFLRLHSPRESLRRKLARVDWIGNALIMASACSCMVALTWGGVRFPWSSPRILVPLVLGGLFNQRYVATFIQGMMTIGVGFYLPTWFQSVKDASPITSGLYFLPIVLTVSPSAVVQGILTTKTGKYRLINLIGWCLSLLGIGLLISVAQHTSIGVIIVSQLIMGVGMGLLYATTFVILAPLDVSDNASAVALMTFLRVFSQAWGVNIAGAILQNSLQTRNPASVINSLPSGTEIAYTVIPLISSMPQALKTEDIPLQSTTDKKWDTVNEKTPSSGTDVKNDEESGSPEKHDV